MSEQPKWPNGKFFVRDNMTPAGGDCRRRCPSTVGVMYPATRFTRVLDDMWCGEYEPKEAEQQDG